MYPNQYERQIVCTYEIIAPPGKTIVLDFEDFDVEDTDSSCSFDSLSIYDGHVDTSKSGSGQEPLQTLCGTDKPAQVIATTNVLTLILRTDGSIQGRGFKANYTWAESGCGGVIKDLGHVLQPPQDAETNRTYESDANCTWLIVAPRNKIVQLTFSSFDLETSSMCWFDYVRVLEGTSPAGTQIGKYCGTNIPPTERTSGSVMTVQFVSDYSAQGEGFRATYEFLDASNCKYCIILDLMIHMKCMNISEQFAEDDCLHQPVTYIRRAGRNIIRGIKTAHGFSAPRWANK